MRATLIIAGVELSVIAWLDFDQAIEPMGGSTLHRMANGAGFKVSSWRKHRITLSAGGWIPPALLGIDYGTPFEIELPIPIGLNIGETLPAGWSSRAAPYGETTQTDQDGKSLRMVYPKMTVFSDGPRQSAGGGARTWELVCEEA